MRRVFAALSFIGFMLPPRDGWAADDDWLGPDKFLHFGVAAAIAGTGYGVSSLVLEERWQRATAGGSAAIAAGAAKELYDFSGEGNASWKDFAWDVAGAAVGVGLALAIDLALGDEPKAQSSARRLAITW